MCIRDSFQTDQSREESQQERVQEIPLSELHPFKGHPFKVLDDDAMQKTVESIAQFGVMTPAIARPRPEGGYELIAGHRRHHASELAAVSYTHLDVYKRQGLDVLRKRER